MTGPPAPEEAGPSPVPDGATAAFWEHAGRGVLAFQRCRRCRSFAHPPVAHCRHCHEVEEPAFDFEPVTGRGEIVNWTVMHDAMVTGFGPQPWVHVLVRLQEQDDLLYAATLLDGPDAPLRLGAPVEVRFQPSAPGLSLPVFALAVTPPGPSEPG